MWLRNHLGARGVGPHWWHEAGSGRDVTEVPDHLGAELLAVPDSGFSAAEKPAPPAKAAAAAPKAEPAAEAAKPAAPASK